MKKLLLLLCMMAGLNCFSQKADPGIILNKGQKIIVTTASTQDADMGMGMQIKNNALSTDSLFVADDAGKNYTLTNTLIALKVSMNFMGQQTDYDSEKKEDRESESGKAISQSLNKTDTLLLEKISGTIFGSTKKDTLDPLTDQANPLEGMIDALGKNTDNATASGAFFIIPKNKKAGENWSDSSSDKKMRTVRTYILRSIEKNIATVSLVSTTEGNTDMEMQGMQITVSMNNKTTGEIRVDIKTGLVAKTSMSSDITGTIELMGQSTPITAKSTIISIYRVN